jgi:hypothetical protein
VEVAGSAVLPVEPSQRIVIGTFGSTPSVEGLDRRPLASTTSIRRSLSASVEPIVNLIRAARWP